MKNENQLHIEAIEFANPRYQVLTVTSLAVDQYCLKKIGKKPAITVVEKVLFAQSYRDQDIISLFFLNIYLPCLKIRTKLNPR